VWLSGLRRSVLVHTRKIQCIQIPLASFLYCYKLQETFVHCKYLQPEHSVPKISILPVKFLSPKIVNFWARELIFCVYGYFLESWDHVMAWDRWDLCKILIWCVQINIRLIFSSLYFLESQNLPLKFGKIWKNIKTPRRDSNLHYVW